MQRIKLLIDARCTLKPFSGIARWTMSLIDHLVNEERYVLCIHIHRSCSDKNHPLNWYFKKLEKDRNISLFYVQSNPFSLNLVYSTNTDVSCDILIYPHYDIPLYIGHRSKARVCVIHDLMPLVVPGYIKKFNLLKQIYFFSRLILTYCLSSSVVCVSKTTKSDLLRYLPFFSQKALFCYPGLNRVNNVSPHRINYEVPCKYNLYIGDRRPHKNLNRLMKLHIILWNDYNMEEDLVICGQPENYEDIIELSPALRRRVHFLVNVPDDQINNLIRNSSSVVLLSKYEGFGLPVIEAGALGKKIIVTDGGALKEVAPAGALVLKLVEDEKLWAPKVISYLNSNERPDPTSVKEKFNWSTVGDFLENIASRSR